MNVKTLRLSNRTTGGAQFEFWGELRVTFGLLQQDDSGQFSGQGFGGTEGILGMGIELWASGGVWKDRGTAVVGGGGARMGWGRAVKG